MKNKKITPEIRKRIFELYDSDLNLKIKTIACEVNYSEKTVRNTLNEGYTTSVFKNQITTPPIIIPLRRDRQSRASVRFDHSIYYDQPTSPSPDPLLLSENNRLWQENDTLKRKLIQVTFERDAANRKVSDLTRTLFQKDIECADLKWINQTQKGQIERLKTEVANEMSTKNKIKDDLERQLKYQDTTIHSLFDFVKKLTEENGKWIKTAIPLMFEADRNTQKKYIVFTKS